MKKRSILLISFAAILLFGCTTQSTSSSGNNKEVESNITASSGNNEEPSITPSLVKAELTSDERFYLSSFTGGAEVFNAKWDDDTIDTLKVNVYRYLDNNWQQKNTYKYLIGGKQKCDFILGTDILDWHFAIRGYDHTKTYSNSNGAYVLHIQEDISDALEANDWMNTSGNHQILKGPEGIVKNVEIPIYAYMRYNDEGKSDEHPNPFLAQFEHTDYIQLTDDTEYYMVTVCFTSSS